MSLEKLCALMKGHEVLAYWCPRARMAGDGTLAAPSDTFHKGQGTKRWAGFFTPNEKLWLISSILDMETYVRTHKLITIKRTWSLIHKYSLVSAFSTCSFTEVHQTDSLLMQTNKGLDSCDLASNSQGNQLILALPFVCGSSMLLPLLYPLGIAISSFW